MKYPKGNLFAIGGAINNNDEEENRLGNFEEGILEQVIKISSKKHKHPVIEILTSASHIPDKAAADYMHCFKKLGNNYVHHLNIDTREKAFENQNIDRIKKCNCLVLTGGDQSRLFSILNNTPVLQLIKEKYHHEDFTIAGVSAGAAAMSATMISSGNAGKGYHKGTVKLSPGFGLINKFIIDTHFDKRGRFGRLIQAVLTKPKLMGMGLGEDTGIFVLKGHKIKIIGSSTVVLVDGSKIKNNNLPAIQENDAIAAENLKVHLLAKGHQYNITTKEFKFH